MNYFVDLLLYILGASNNSNYIFSFREVRASGKILWIPIEIDALLARTTPAYLISNIFILRKSNLQSHVGRYLISNRTKSWHEVPKPLWIRPCRRIGSASIDNWDRGNEVICDILRTDGIPNFIVIMITSHSVWLETVMLIRIAQMNRW